MSLTTVRLLLAGTLTALLAACGGGDDAPAPAPSPDAPASTVELFAGSAKPEANIDGVGTLASFVNPAALARDAAGSFYIADQGANTVRKLTVDGTVTTIAGLTPASTLNEPQGIAVGPSGDVWVADTGSHTVRRIATDGTVTLMAGTSGVSGSALGPVGTSRLNAPQSVAVDARGYAYVADTQNCAVRRVSPTGNAEDWLSTPGGCGAFWPGTNVSAGWVTNIALSDDGGTLFMLANLELMRYDTRTRLPIIWPNQTSGSSPDVPHASWAISFAGGGFIGGSAYGLSTQGNDALLYARTYDAIDRRSKSQLTRVTPDGVRNSIADLRWGYRDGAADQALVRTIVGIEAVGSELYLLDQGNDALRIRAADGSIRTFVGGAAGAYVDGPRLDSRLGGDLRLAAASGGALAVADNVTQRMRWIDSAGNVSTHPAWHAMTVRIGALTSDARSTLHFVSEDRVVSTFGLNLWTLPASASDWIQQPCCVTTAGFGYGSLALALGSGGRYYTIGPQGQFDKSGGLLRRNADGTVNVANPGPYAGLVTSGNDELFATDRELHAVYRIDGLTGQATLRAGRPNAPGATDGAAADARFKTPTLIAIDPQKRLYVLDEGNRVIRLISADGSQVITWAQLPAGDGAYTSMAVQGDWLYFARGAAIFRAGPISGS